MCGIAGYNAGDQVIDKFLKDRPGRQKEIIRQAWLHNLHRGYDAAGYMGHRLNDELDFFKSSGHAVDILQHEIDQDDFIVEPMRTFGAHTRAATQGDAKLVYNNHPVLWNDIFVTHNGRISNDDSLRKWLVPAGMIDAFPEVDSAVIPLVLDHYMDSPYDTKGLKLALQNLQGAFTFHAIWRDCPGVSVVVRGKDRPLVIAHLEGSLFAYGSEPESVWAMINNMGINPNKGFNWYELKTEKALIIENGSIIEAIDFNVPFGANKGQNMWSRWLPRSKKLKRQLVWRDNAEYLFPNKAKIKSVWGNEEKFEVVYTREDGFVSDKHKYPTSSQTTIEAAVSEFEIVYKNENYWHGIIGSTEVVFTDARVIQDVYDHSTWKNSQRWSVEKPEDKKPDPPMTNIVEIVRSCMSILGTIKTPKEKSEFQYVKDMAEAARKRANTPKAQAPVKTGQSSSRDTDSIYDDDDDGEYLGVIEVTPKINFDNIQDIVHHQTEDMFFVKDITCMEHKQLFSVHENPEDCETLLYAAIYSMGACESLDLVAYGMPGLKLDYATSDSYCLDEPGDAMCSWAPAEIVKVHARSAAWYVTVSELCTKCSSWRAMSEEPAWWNLLRVDTPDYIAFIRGDA